jgi:hypothetical protein
MESRVREQFLRSALKALGEHGYEDLDYKLLGRGGDLGTAELEDEFGDLDDCLFEAYRSLSGRLVAIAKAPCEEGLAWPERVRRSLVALLGELANDPTMALVVIRSFPAIRPAAYRLYVELLDSFAGLLEEGRSLATVAEELPAEVELLGVGAAEAIVFAEIDAGRGGELPSILPEVLFSVLVPFIGPEAAAEEMRSASVAG